MTAIERVLVAGASGRTGRQALRQLEPTDLDVRALTRSAAKTERLQRLGADEVVVGDLLSRDDARTAVDGVDAVFTTVGSSPMKVLRGTVRETEFVDGEGNVNLVEAAVDAGVETVGMVSSLGAGDDRNSWMAHSFRVTIRPVLEAKTRAEATIRESGLRYTILRPGLLTTRWAPGRVHVASAGNGLWGAVTCTALARLLVGAPFTPAAADRTLEVASNPLYRHPSGVLEWQLPA